MIPVWIPAPPEDEEPQPEWLIGEDRERWEFWRGKVALI